MGKRRGYCRTKEAPPDCGPHSRCKPGISIHFAGRSFLKSPPPSPETQPLDQASPKFRQPLQSLAALPSRRFVTPPRRAGWRAVCAVPLRVHNEVTRNQHGGGSWANGHRRPKGDGALPRAPPPACGGRLAASKTTWRDPASRSAPLRSAFGDLVRRPQCWQLSAGQSPEARRTAPPPHAPSGKVAWTARPLQLARKKEEMGTARGVRDTGPIAGLWRAARWGSPGTTY